LYWTTDVNCELPIKMAASGMSSAIKPETISAAFIRTCKNRESSPAMHVMRDNKELTWTWNKFYDDAMAFAKALQALGVDERKAINIMGFNSPEWVLAFFGGILHNNVLTGVYITNGPEACQYQAAHSEAQVIVCDT